jgi:pimeloyl-ACP methyl ester carboxylesterase
VPLEDSFFSNRADGGSMSYRRIGEGMLVVCLAGGPGANAEYLEDLGGLSRDHRLVIPDARGTGKSPAPETLAGYGFDELADDVEVLRDHLGLERMALLAHSAACTTALVYAANHPVRLRALILVAPSRWLYDEIEDDTEEILQRRADEPWYPAVRAARGRLNDGPNPDEVPDLLAALAPASYAEWGEKEQAHAVKIRPGNWDATRMFWQTQVDGQEVRARLGLVEAPVLAITGELDAMTGVTPGVAWAGCFPNARHQSMTRSGHNPWVDQRETFAKLVRDFLVVAQADG